MPVPTCAHLLLCPCYLLWPPLSLQGLASQLGGQQLGAEQVAAALLGQRCWVKWPYLQEAVVEGVSDSGAQHSAHYCWTLLFAVC